MATFSPLLSLCKIISWKRKYKETLGCVSSFSLLLLCLGSRTQSTFCNIFHKINNLFPIWQRTKHNSVFNSLLLSAMCVILNLSKFWENQGLYEVMIFVFINILHYIKGKLTFFDLLHPKCLFKTSPCFLPLFWSFFFFNFISVRVREEENKLTCTNGCT